MGEPQLVGLNCSSCHKVIDSIADGTFCPNCGNPVHFKCQQLDGGTVPEGCCPTCKGDVQSPIAVEVRAERDREATAGHAKLYCPNCGSTRGFRPFRPDNGPPGTKVIPLDFTIGSFFLLGWLFQAATGGELQCTRCDYVFRPRSRLREFGCLALLLLAVAGLLALVILPRL